METRATTTNRQAKEKVAKISLCDLKAGADAIQLPTQFAELLSENLSNCNVLHLKNAGYTEHFDGQRWVKMASIEVAAIVSTWAEKFKEYFDLLGEKHGDAWLKSFEALYASNVIDKFNDRHSNSNSTCM